MVDSVQKGRDSFRRYKKIIFFLTKAVKVFPTKLRRKIFVFFRRKKGKTGIVIRYVLLKSIIPSIGDNVAVYEDVYIKNIDKLTIGRNVSIHPMSYLDAAGGIEIGNDVSIAHGVTVMSSSHEYMGDDVPIKYQRINLKKTTIGNNVWIGAKATILFGVTIGDGCVIGANSLVNKDIPAKTVAGGIPAKKIKER